MKDVSNLKVALVHDWLNTKRGGAERVLFNLALHFPDAPIYTLIYNQALFEDAIPPERVIASGLQRMPKFLKKRSRLLLPLIPKHVEGFDLSGFDLVISNSSAFVKNVITAPETIHICYCNTPMRFAWDYWPRYLDEQNLNIFTKHLVRRQINKLRVWDYYGSQRVDHWIVNSKHVAKRVQKYYHQNPTVIYPPVKTLGLNHAVKDKGNYYVTAAMHTPYKKLDLAIEAMNQRGEKLIVLGDGPDRKRLEKLAKPNIVFKGYVSEQERARIISSAKALLFPGEEDFGIAMVEALAAGTPVVAFNVGGAKEIIKDGKTGILYNEQSAHGINQALDRLGNSPLDRRVLSIEATRFDEETFKKNILDYVQKVIENV